MAFGASRTLGNLQPFFDFLSTGRVDLLAGNVGRRAVRILAGRAFSRAEFGNGSLLLAILGLLFGRSIGHRGRW